VPRSEKNGSPTTVKAAPSKTSSKMVFLIQNSQNRDSAAIQVKLDELIRVSKASNTFMGLEHLTDDELQEIEGKCEGRAKAVLEARTASEDAKRKLRVIDGDG